MEVKISFAMCLHGQINESFIYHQYNILIFNFQFIKYFRLKLFCNLLLFQVVLIIRRRFSILWSDLWGLINQSYVKCYLSWLYSDIFILYRIFIKINQMVNQNFAICCMLKYSTINWSFPWNVVQTLVIKKFICYLVKMGH